MSETEEAITDIETGRIVSGEEVLNWLKTWGTEALGKAPEHGY